MVKFAEMSKAKLFAIGGAVIVVVAAAVVGAFYFLTAETRAVTDALNDTMTREAESWGAAGPSSTINVYSFQHRLDIFHPDYKLIATGNAEFTAAPSSPEYTSELSGYGGLLYGDLRAINSTNDVTYALVYSSDTEAYYSVRLSYAKAEPSGAEYVVFSNAKRL